MKRETPRGQGKSESRTGGKRPGAGRKAVHIDLEQLERLCGLQCTDEEVASVFNVSARTIERRKGQPAFAEAMARGKARGCVSLRRSLWALAAKGNPAANIFLAKNLLGLRDYFSNEHSGPDGGPIVIGPAPEFADYTDEELKQLSALLSKAERPRKG
jgi:hypothetical protein